MLRQVAKEAKPIFAENRTGSRDGCVPAREWRGESGGFWEIVNFVLRFPVALGTILVVGR